MKPRLSNTFVIIAAACAIALFAFAVGHKPAAFVEAPKSQNVDIRKLVEETMGKDAFTDAGSAFLKSLFETGHVQIKLNDAFVFDGGLEKFGQSIDALEKEHGMTRLNDAGPEAIDEIRLSVHVTQEGGNPIVKEFKVLAAYRLPE